MNDDWLIEVDFDGTPGNADDAAFTFYGTDDQFSGKDFPAYPPRIYWIEHGDEIDPPGRQPTLYVETSVAQDIDEQEIRLFSGTFDNPNYLFSAAYAPEDVTQFQLPELPTDSEQFGATVSSRVGHDDISHAQPVAGKAIIAIGELSLDMVRTKGLAFTIDPSATGEQIAEIDVELARVNEQGSLSYQVSFDAQATDPLVGPATRIGMKNAASTLITPGPANPMARVASRPLTPLSVPLRALTTAFTISRSTTMAMEPPTMNSPRDSTASCCHRTSLTNSRVTSSPWARRRIEHPSSHGINLPEAWAERCRCGSPVRRGGKNSFFWNSPSRQTRPASAPFPCRPMLI